MLIFPWFILVLAIIASKTDSESLFWGVHNVSLSESLGICQHLMGVQRLFMEVHWCFMGVHRYFKGVQRCFKGSLEVSLKCLWTPWNTDGPQWNAEGPPWNANGPQAPLRKWNTYEPLKNRLSESILDIFICNCSQNQEESDKNEHTIMIRLVKHNRKNLCPRWWRFINPVQHFGLIHLHTSSFLKLIKCYTFYSILCGVGMLLVPESLKNIFLANMFPALV